MRKTTEIIATVGAVLSAVAGFLLTIYLEDAKKFLDDLLSRLFGIPKSMVGYNVVTVVIIVLVSFAVFIVVYFLVTWVGSRFRSRKYRVETPPMIQPLTLLRYRALLSCLPGELGAFAGLFL